MLKKEIFQQNIALLHNSKINGLNHILVQICIETIQL